MSGGNSREGVERVTSPSRRRVLQTIGGAGAAGLAGCAGSGGGSGGGGGSNRDFFKFGVVTSLSGNLRYGGQVTKRGYDLWKKAINEKGGIKVGDERHEVKLSYTDAKSKPSAAASATQKMVSNENVDAVLGPYSSRIPLAIGSVLDKNKTPCITGSSESPRIWKKQFKYLFGTIPSVNVYIAKVAESLVNMKPNAKSVYVSGVNGPFSKAAAQGMRKGAKAAGADVAGFELYPVDASRSSIVSKAKSKSPDLHMNTGNIDSNVKFVKAAKQAGYLPNGIVQHYGINTPSYKNLGSPARYTLGASLWLPKVKRSGGALWGDAKSFTEAFKSEYEGEPDYTEAASSATGVVFQQALGKLGAKPPLSQEQQTELVNVLENITVKTFWGEINYQTEGANYHNNTQTQPLTIQLDDELNPQILDPESYASEPTYPVPGWGER